MLHYILKTEVHSIFVGTSVLTMLISKRAGSETQILEKISGKHSLRKGLKCHWHLASSGWDLVTPHHKIHIMQTVRCLQN